MTVVSTPAWSSCMALVWRRMCGESRLPCKEGQACSARAAYLARRRSTASRLRGPPRLVGNSVSGFALTFLQPDAEDSNGGGGERSAALFSPLALAAQMGASAQRHVLAGQADKLRDPQPGLNGNRQQSAVASTDPAGAVGTGKQRVDLRSSQEGDQRLVSPLGRNGQHPLDHRSVLGVEERSKAEQGMHGGEADVAGGHGIAPLGLEVVQEGADERGVQIVQVELSGRPPRLVTGEAEQQPEGVAVCSYGVRARLALADKPLSEECLQGWSERAHTGCLSDWSRRVAARDSNSGVADKYQYVQAGAACPR